MDLRGSITSRQDFIGRVLGAAAPRRPIGIAIGIAAAALAILLRFLATPFVGDGEALLTAFPLLLVASLTGARWGGWTCLVVCTIASWYLFIGDAFTFSFGPNEKGILIGTFLAGAFVIQISMLLRRAFAEIIELRTTETLLARELEHRIKNTLTLVISIARQTFRADRGARDALADFEGRMIALAAAQEITTAAPREPANMSEIVERSLLPFCGTSIHERVRLSGPNLKIDHNRTVGLFLVFHELATNAAKYGALSAEGGVIDVGWREDAAKQFVLTWTERDGPAVVPPDRAGFGSKLIDRIVTRSLSGSIAATYRTSGLEIVLSAPIANPLDGIAAPSF